MPTIHKITRHAGIAGQYAMTVQVQYEGEETFPVTFIGSTYGGPIVMQSDGGREHFVSGNVTDRIGSKLDESWVRRFFSDDT